MNKKAYWWPAQNFGDTLMPFIIDHILGYTPEMAGRTEGDRILGIGSIIHLVRPGDVVFGSGSNRPGHVIKSPPGAKYLCVRGPKTRDQIRGADVPEIYGDPAIILPLMYWPEVKKKYKLGILPHYVDKHICPKPGPGETVIDIQAHWTEVIQRILECEVIIASTLHGIIAAEAYGIPSLWAVWGNKIIGGEFKFQDYFLGTGRTEQIPGKRIPPIPDLAKRQQDIINSLQEYAAYNF